VANAITRPLPALGLATLIFALDQLVKWLVINPLQLYQRGQIELIQFFNLTWVENHGISLGLFAADSAGDRWLLVGLTALVAVFVAVWLWRERSAQDRLALGLVLGGALGNIVDRVRFGYVVDYADLHFGEWRPFLVFNVADAAITIGVLLLIVRALLIKQPADRAENEHA
jgi:signal peptidase II